MKLILALSFLFVFGFTNNVLAENTDPTTAEDIQFGDMVIRLDPNIAGAVRHSAEEPYQDWEMGMRYPRHHVLTFERYVLTGALPLRRQIRVYLREDDQDVVFEGTRIPERLEAMIERAGSGLRSRDVSLIPPQMAGMLLFSHPERIEGENLIGVRFLTYLGQDMSWPVENRLLYVFHGFTADRSRLITAWLTVQRPALPLDADAAPAWDAMRAKYNELQKEIGSLSTMAFTPELDRLDRMILSIR
ncbi:MAG: hypothetical protein EA426_17520 [Spirochaetaceae bacterium]|nr:MAG: hypothetical protein EA426_17520 [Spirochaetaceae bacterium]